MRRYALLFVLVVPIIIGMSIASTPALADKYAVEDGDYLDYGYQMLVEGAIVETRTERALVASCSLVVRMVSMASTQIRSPTIHTRRLSSSAPSAFSTR